LSVHHGPEPILVNFVAGSRGKWKIDRITSVRGDTLPSAGRLDMIEGTELDDNPDTQWSLRGFTSNPRYTNRSELTSLVARQEDLGRPTSLHVALIPIRKRSAWWGLPQDERRIIFEEQSHHVRIGFEYLPSISRRLHHSRDLGQPFDFLTWFEYAPEDSSAFEQLVARHRRTREWSFVDREVDIRLIRD
jgi:hypothetical protein